MRLRLSFTLALLTTTAASAQDPAAVRATLDEAKRRYADGLALFQDRVRAQFTAREEKIRGAKNGRALLKAHAAEKEYFEDGGDLPLWMPTAVGAERDRLTRDLEAAYQTAIQSLTKAKQDEAAGKVEADLHRLWEKRFEKIDYKAAAIKDGYLHLPPRTAISTLEEHAGPIEIYAVARTAKENIRLYAYQGSTLILLWEKNPKEVRVHWPDGKADQFESGTAAKADITPLKPNTFYQIRWLIGPTGITVYLNDRKVFSQAKPLALDGMKAKVVVHSCEDELDVKEFRVRRLVVEP